MDTDALQPAAPRRCRRWFQFSLRTLFVVVTLAAVVCGIFLWFNRPTRPGHYLPSFAVARMTVAYIGLDHHDVVVDIPTKQIPLIVAAFVGGSADSSPANWIVLGALTLQSADGQEARLEVFIVDDKELAFRTDGEHYFRGVNAKPLMGILKSVTPE
jgi:hypothetical protein